MDTIEDALRVHWCNCLQIHSRDTIGRLRSISLEINLKALHLACLLRHRHQVELAFQIWSRGLVRLFEMIFFHAFIDCCHLLWLLQFLTRTRAIPVIFRLQLFLCLNLSLLLLLSLFIAAYITAGGVGSNLRHRWYRRLRKTIAIDLL